jgi:hypothetical protein
MNLKSIPHYIKRVISNKHRKSPKYHSHKEPRIAVCFYGIVGGIKGKAGESVASSSQVLEIAHKYNKKHIFDKNSNVDVFVHTWSIDLKKDIERLYQPKKAIYQPQIQFEIPDYVGGSSRRRFGHYSRWFSSREVLKLKKDYEREKDFTYDLVFITRFDAAPEVDFIFKEFDPQYFYTAHWYAKTHRYFPIYIPMGYPYLSYSGIADIWFLGNSKDLDHFATLYDHLNEYNKPENCPRDNNGISNHILTTYHLRKIGVLERLRFRFMRVGWIGFLPKPRYLLFNYVPKESTPLVRRKFFGDLK